MERTKKNDGKAPAEKETKQEETLPQANTSEKAPEPPKETKKEKQDAPKVTKEEQAPVIDLDAPIWFKKLGGGSLRLRISGKPQIIPPGQKFKARPSEIPVSFKDVVLPLEQIPTAETQKAVIAGKTPVFIKAKYEPKEGETFEQSMFNIVNSTGKVLNQKPLTEADADSLLKDML